MDFQSIALPAELSALMAPNHSEIQRLAAYYRLILNLQPLRSTERIRPHRGATIRREVTCLSIALLMRCQSYFGNPRLDLAPSAGGVQILPRRRPLSIREKLRVLIVEMPASRRRSRRGDRRNAGRVSGHGPSLPFPVRCITGHRLGKADWLGLRRFWRRRGRLGDGRCLRRSG